jgi:hypothetical protein
VDAILKWAPQIRGDILTVLTEALDGQPAWEQAWIHLWVSLASIDPILFGTFIALVETALALSLVTGIASRYALYCKMEDELSGLISQAFALDMDGQHEAADKYTAQAHELNSRMKELFPSMWQK